MKNIVKIAVGIVALSSISFGGYYYFSGNNLETKMLNSLEEKNIIKKQESIIKKKKINTEKKENSGLNYTFNTKASFKIKERGRENGFDLEIKNASIITKDNGLKERIKLENLDLNIIGEEKINLSNIDIVSKNENVYLKGNFGKISNNFSSKFKEILEKGKYAKIDNSKPILDILGELQKNNLIKELVTGATTSNPEEYYKNHKTIEKLLAELKLDNLLNFVFKDGEYDDVTKKTSLVFNEKLCDLNGIVENLLPGKPSKERCIKDLKQANQFLSFINIYKQGDSKAGNYKFVINQGSLVDISIDYKNHIINTWALSLVEPTGRIVIKANGNTDKILASLFKINISENGIKINGEIKDGKGKIIVKSDENDSEFNLNGFLKVENYGLNSYELNGNSSEFKLISKANQKEGHLKVIAGEDYNLEINYKEEVLDLDLKSKNLNAKGKVNKNNMFFNLEAQDYSGKQIAKMDLKADYSSLAKANYDLNLESFKGNIKSELSLLKKYFKFHIQEKSVYLRSLGDLKYEWNLEYNDGQIKGDFYENNKKVFILIGNFKNLGEFDLKVEFPREDALINIVGEKNKDIYKYSLIANIDGKETSKGKAKIDILDNKINSNGFFKTTDNKFEANYNFEFDYKKGSAKYEIPKEFEEVDIKLFEINKKNCDGLPGCYDNRDFTDI